VAIDGASASELQKIDWLRDIMRSWHLRGAHPAQRCFCGST
jgi:hypothetical protein